MTDLTKKEWYRNDNDRKFGGETARKTSEDAWLTQGDVLLCFGDSLTAAKEGYVRILTELLSPRGIKVCNGGLGGDKTPQALTRLFLLVEEFHPTAINFLFGTNDAVIGRGEWANEPRVLPETYQQLLVWMIHLLKVRKSGIRKFSITTPCWRCEGRTYEQFGDVLPPYRQAARDAAAETGAVLVPLDVAQERFTQKNEFRRDPESGLLFTVDGCHPTVEGYGVIAETMLKSWKMQ